MDIPWTNIHRYMHQIEFPKDILEDNGSKVALRASRKDLEELILTKSVYGKGTWNKLKSLRLLVRVEELSCRISALDRLLDRPPTGIPYVYDDDLGDTRSVTVLKRFVTVSISCTCRLCGAEWRTTLSAAETYRKHIRKCALYPAALAKLTLQYPTLSAATRDELMMEKFLIRVEQGEFHRWDNSFSLAELRRNPNEVESEETRTRRADEKRF